MAEPRKITLMDQDANYPRIETGPLQIEDDWPGVFIRGDNALHHAMTLKSVLTAINNGFAPPPIELATLRGLVALLQSCSAGPSADEPTGLPS